MRCKMCGIESEMEVKCETCGWVIPDLQIEVEEPAMDNETELVLILEDEE